MGMFVFSCENDLNEVKVITETDDMPDEIMNDFHLMYSDSGIVRFEIFSVRTENYSLPKKKTLFKSGFEVRFYKKKDSLVSVLTAEYGELHKDENKVIARNNVIFTNFEKKQKLKTEELFWDQARKRAYTDKRFEIFGDGMYGHGKGLTCDETFSDYETNDSYFEYEVEREENDTLQ